MAKKVGLEVSDARQARELILNDKTPFNVVEAYKAARTNLIFTMDKSSDSKAVVVTSAMANDGKTTSCINLAITFAQTGSKVLLIDSDMRNPSVHRYLKGVKNAPGLSNVLGGFNSIAESVQKTEYNNLSVMSAGVIPPNPSELIYSDAIEQMQSNRCSANFTRITTTFSSTRHRSDLLLMHLSSASAPSVSQLLSVRTQPEKMQSGMSLTTANSMKLKCLVSS